MRLLMIIWLNSIKKISRKKLLFLFLSAFSIQAFAQDKLPVTEAFEILEQHYEIRFSYVESDLENIYVSLPAEGISLTEAVQVLNTHPLLRFNLVDNTRIAVAFKDQINICAFVVDVITQQALPGASVYISTQKATVTNEEGKFVLEDSDPHALLTISYMGYESKQLPVSEIVGQTASCQTILLKPIQYELSEVVVTNIFTTGINQKIDGSIDMSTKDFGILPGLVNADVLQTIQILPGVESVNESVADINIRGGSHDQNLILWDDIKMYHSGHFFGLISSFNPQITSKINVVKNGTSAEFTDGISGTITMQSDNEIHDKFCGSSGSNMISADAVFQIPINDKLAFHLSGRRSFTDLYASPAYEAYFKRSFQDSKVTGEENENTETNSDFFFYDFSSKLLYDINEKHKLRVSLLNVYNDLIYEERTANAENTETLESSLTQENLGLGASLTSEWNSLKTELKTYYTKYELEAFDVKANTGQKLLQRNEVLETGMKFNLKYKISNSLSWLSGYSFTETGTKNASFVQNPTYRIIKKNVMREHGLFSELSYSKNTTYARIGARGNYLERLGLFLVEPRLNLNQKLSDAISLKLQGELKHQATTQFVDLNEDFLGVESRRWVVSDQEMIPILKSRQVSVGADYKNNGWFIELTGFYKNIEGIITESQEFNVQNQYDGFTGSGSSIGTEFLLSKRFLNGNSWISYTYNNNQYEFKEVSAYSFPANFNISHSISTGAAYSIYKNLKISTGFIWKTGKPYTKPVENEQTFQDGNFTRVNYEEPNRHNLPDYMRVDASISYYYNFTDTSSLSVTFGGLNILNRKNVINRYYRVSSDDSATAQEIDNVSLTFTPNVSARFNF